MMKTSAYLIDTARAELVDMDALQKALERQTIRGAALDYVAPEGAPNPPLLSLPNVYVTPHSAALTREALYKMAMQAAEEIDRVLSGKRPLWPVPPTDRP